MLPIIVDYNGVGAELLTYIESLTLSDVLSGEASTLSVTLSNIDGRFTGNWAAVKGDVLNFSLGSAKTRAYAIDKITVNTRPATVVWACTARPATSRKPSGGSSGRKPPPPEAATLNTRASWPAITGLSLSALLARVAGDVDMSHKYAADNDPDLGTVARYQESAWRLLTRQARRFGCTVNASADMLTIVNAKRSSAAVAPVPQVAVELELADIESLANSDSMAPAKVRTVKIDPALGEISSVDAVSGDGEEILVPSTGGDSEAILALHAALAREVRITIFPREIVAGAIVETPVGRFEVKKVDYSLSATAETMSLTCKGV